MISFSAVYSSRRSMLVQVVSTWHCEKVKSSIVVAAAERPDKDDMSDFTAD